MLPPGSTIGILGGGQLGRMTALAAANLGYRTHIFVNEADSPAVQVSAAATIAPFGDAAALARFAAAVDVATCEFENVPAAALRRVAAKRPVLPRPEIIEIAQDRLREKTFLRSIGVATAEFRAVDSPAALDAAAREIGRPAVLKTVRLGYDGKGQVTLRPDTEADEAWRRMGAPQGILESFVDFACEISVVLARAADGSLAAYPAVENRHVNHILDTTIAPARIAPEIAARGRGDRPPYRRAARPRRRARGRDVRHPIGGDHRQRAGAAAAQFRPLDDRCLRHQPVRAAGARDLRLCRSARPSATPTP